MLERRRDLSSIPVRESCSKARGEQKGGEWRRASEATGPDIGPVLSLSRPPPPPHSAFGRFSPFLFLVHCVAFSRWASNRNRDPSKASSVAPCTSRSSTFCLLALIRSSLFLILIPQFILNDLARSFAFFLLVFFELCILSMKIVRERMQFLTGSSWIGIVTDCRDFRTILSFYRVPRNANNHVCHEIFKTGIESSGIGKKITKNREEVSFLFYDDNY